MATSVTTIPSSGSSTGPSAGTRAAKAAVGFTQTQIALTLAFIIGHIILGIVMRAFPAIATLHATACLFAGLVFAATTRQVRNISVAVAYIAGCEVLWRMTKASVFWEFGKYGIASLLLVALFRVQSRRNRSLAIAYFLLLVPSVVLTVFTLDPESARQDVSFYLSGPLALTTAVLFFSNIRLGSSHRLATLLGFIGPVVAIGALSFISTRAQDQIEFVNAANSVASGGFGPNQVSAVLGLAVMFLLLIIVERKLPWVIRLSLLALGAALAAQAALTFARGGLLLALAGSGVAMFLLLRGNRRGRVTVLIVGTLSFVLAKYVIEPRLEEITAGEISERYSSTKSSGRDLFVLSELELFEEHPTLGVGPGIGMRIRAERGEFFGASHTEYSRMLAEHGIFGVFALGCLIALGIRAIKQATQPTARAFATGMVIWVALFLLVYGTRIAAPSFVFGLAFARPLPIARTRHPSLRPLRP